MFTIWILSDMVVHVQRRSAAVYVKFMWYGRVISDNKIYYFPVYETECLPSFPQKYFNNAFVIEFQIQSVICHCHFKLKSVHLK